MSVWESRMWVGAWSATRAESTVVSVRQTCNREMPDQHPNASPLTHATAWSRPQRCQERGRFGRAAIERGVQQPLVVGRMTRSVNGMTRRRRRPPTRGAARVPESKPRWPLRVPRQQARPASAWRAVAGLNSVAASSVPTRCGSGCSTNVM